MTAARERRPALVAAALGGLFFGYDTGIIGAVLLFARRDLHLGAAGQGALVSAVACGSVFGAALSGAASRRAGRRSLLVASGAAFALATTAAAAAPSLALLLAARFAGGLALGLTATIAPVYAAELAPAHTRGRYVGAFQLAIVTGILAAAIAGWLLAGAHAWRAMLLVGALPAAALAALGRRLPESPAWSPRGRGAPVGLGASWAALWRRDVRLVLVAGVGLAVLQQLIGINAVIFFAPTIAEMSGVGSTSAATLAAVGVAAVNLVGTVAVMPLLDRVPRRSLLLAGAAGIEVALLGLAYAFSGAGGAAGGVAVASLMVYVGAFAMSFGPVVWLVNAEAHPRATRAAGSALATVANRGTSFGVSLAFLPLVAAVGPATTFLCFAAVTGAAFAFCWFIVPETRGSTLEQVDAAFGRQA